MIPKLFYSKVDIKRFKEKAMIKAQKDYDKQMRAQVQDMLRQAMSVQIEAARARGATEKEIEDMLPKTPEEMLKVLGNAPAAVMAPPKMLVPKDDTNRERRISMTEKTKEEEPKKKDKSRKKKKKSKNSSKKQDTDDEEEEDDSSNNEEIEYPGSSDRVSDDDILGAFGVHSEASIRRIKSSAESPADGNVPDQGISDDDILGAFGVHSEASIRKIKSSATDDKEIEDVPPDRPSNTKTTENDGFKRVSITHVKSPKRKKDKSKKKKKEKEVTTKKEKVENETIEEVKTDTEVQKEEETKKHDDIIVRESEIETEEVLSGAPTSSQNGTVAANRPQMYRKNHDELGGSQHDIINGILGTSFSETIDFEALLPDSEDEGQGKSTRRSSTDSDDDDDSDSDYSFDEESQRRKQSSKPSLQSNQRKSADGSSWDRLLARSMGIKSPKPEKSTVEPTNVGSTKSPKSEKKTAETNDAGKIKSPKAKKKMIDGKIKSPRSTKKKTLASVGVGSPKSSKGKKKAVEKEQKVKASSKSSTDPIKPMKSPKAKSSKNASATESDNASKSSRKGSLTDHLEKFSTSSKGNSRGDNASRSSRRSRRSSVNDVDKASKSSQRRSFRRSSSVRDIGETKKPSSSKRRSGSLSPSPASRRRSSQSDVTSKSDRRSSYRRKGRKKDDEIVLDADEINCTVEYFEMVLATAKERCEREFTSDFQEKPDFTLSCKDFFSNWKKRMKCENSIDDIVQKNGSFNEFKEMESLIKEANDVLPELKQNCVQKGAKIFQQLDLNRLLDFQVDLVRGAIVAEATPTRLAYFAEGSIENESLLKSLFSDFSLMKQMLIHGGPSKNNFGNAMKIYTQCINTMDSGDGESHVAKVNRKIALACALEFAFPVNEFESIIEIDPVARYKHFEMAHSRGDLDPAFPHFSVWEMRHIVNCDAPNAQMKWCREMVMNYAPHLTCITTSKLRYVYILDSDVRSQKERSAESPKTYEMILSEGGDVTAKSSFGKFILQSFGLPVWGSKFRGQEGFLRWTSDGWEAMNGADWKTGRWKGRESQNFRKDMEARSKAAPGEYFNNVVLMECLADILDGAPDIIPEEEKDSFHPNRFWRSLSVFSKRHLALRKESRGLKLPEKGFIITKCEEYLEAYQNDAPDSKIAVDKDSGTITFPASRCDLMTGNIIEIESFGGGKQLNFLADGIVEYVLPESAPSKKYLLSFEFCTVSERQSPVIVKVCEDETVEFETSVDIPYSSGRWQRAEPIEIEAKGSTLLRFSRGKNSSGMALKKVVLS